MRRLAAVLLAVVGLILVPAPGASALPDLTPDCKSAPTPEVPGRGVVGFFESPPEVPPPVGDPFAPDSATSIYEQYGYAGLRWNVYDLGCGPDISRSPDAVIGTAIANWMITFPKAAVAATGAILGAAFSPAFLGVFDPLISKVVEAMRVALFERWYVLAVAALGLMLIIKARTQEMASTASAIAWAILVMVLVTVIGRWPLIAGHAADESVTTVLASVSASLAGKPEGTASTAGTEATAQMHEALLYQAWLGGTFGDANSAVAKKYGPTIFTSTALTWAEAKTLQDDPDAGKEIIARKQAAFTEAASKIQEADPDAYEYLIGKRSDTRVGYALLAGLAALCTVPFLFAAGLLVLGALIIIRFGVMLFPAFATLGLFPTMGYLVTGIGGTCAAALINATLFGIGASVTIAAMGFLLAPDVGLPSWLQIILMLILTVVMWVMLSPFRRLTQMVGQRNHFSEATGAASSSGRGALRLLKRVGTLTAGTAVGGVAGAAVVERMSESREPAVQQRAEARTTQPVADQPKLLTAGPRHVRTVTPQPIEGTVIPAPQPESAPIERAETRPAVVVGETIPSGLVHIDWSEIDAKEEVQQ